MSAINYSKWDNIELSDDEDFECHPNVDKKSFIKWKQQDIHRQREERRQNIQDLTHEVEMNKDLLERIDVLATTVNLSSISSLARTIDQLRARGQEPDAPRATSDGPAYDTMIAALLAQVQTEIAETKVPENDGEKVTQTFLERIKDHKEKLSQQQQTSKAKLEKLKKEEESKLTMDTMCKPGFDKTSVNKSKVEPPPPSAKTGSTKKKEKSIQVLNPESANNHQSIGKEDGDDEEEEDILTSDIAREFSKLRDFPKSFEFITKHPYIVTEAKSDEILAAAFESQMKGKPKTAKLCVHQALVLKYCAQLGKDGVSLFFRRMSTPGKPLSVFTKDVEDTYAHIKNRCTIIKAEKEAKSTEGERETIQLYTPDPSKPINFRIPTEETDPEGFAIFNSFPQDFREALAAKQLEKVNKVLDKMEYSVAEGLVEKLGEAQILSIEPEVRDAAGLKRLEEEARRERESEAVMFDEDVAIEK